MVIENTDREVTKAMERKEDSGNSTKNIRAVIYARTSKIGENESFFHQVNICYDFIKEKGWTLCDIFFDECGDRRGIDRPELTNMLYNASKCCFDVVVVSSEERLSRFPEDLSEVVKILIDSGIKLFSTDNMNDP